MNKLKSIQDFQRLKETIKKSRDPSKPCITVCCGTGCSVSGGRNVFARFQEEINKRKIDVKVDTKATGCHGFCEKGPLVVIFPKKIFYQRVNVDDVPEIVRETVLNDKIIDRLLYVDPATGEKLIYEPDVPFYKKQERVIFGTNGMIDPNNIEDYIAVGGYDALAKTLNSLSQEKIINEITKSGLRGRGGAGFPTGKKWSICRSQKAEPKYIICNADEGDPGAFMDRSLLEGNPHSVLEGMIIGAYAIGAHEGYIYVRAEYPLACKNIQIAINQAEECGFLGKNILGSEFSFKVHVKRGAGAFVCGEESALIASIEGRPGEPTPRPPYPAEKGLWGKPTNINNVKTWASVSHIINQGADWYSKIGTKTSKGTMIFSLVGKVNNTGLVEVPMGITLRDMVYEIGGGIPGDKRLKAVQTGGPSGGCIPWELTTIPVDYEELTKVGSMMGSGGCVVVDEDTCMVNVAKYFLSFTMAESCGKCTPCREGNARLLDILTQICEGNGKEGDIELLEELAETIIDGSLCGLGKTAPNPVLTTIRYFRDEYEQHIKYKRCPAVVCKDIISSPCHFTCPIKTDVPSYIALISRGEFKDALNLIRDENPLPLVCGRVCHKPCEQKCRSGDGGDPIAIRALKRFVTDYELKEGIPDVTPFPKRYEEKVAIIGAGPAGLTCGYFLAKEGYPVTIFEKYPLPGGMLRVGIPDYRLPKEILDLEIEIIKKSGVEIKTNTEIGKDITLKQLLKNGYKAIFIATGAHKNKKLGIPGEDTEGVYDPIEFLAKVNLEKEAKIGTKIAVVGGGNSAIDAARTALRLGAERVTILYRRTRKEMPANPEEIEYAIEEGIDIQFLTLPKRAIVKNGKLVGVECIKMRLGDFDKSQRRTPMPAEGSEFTIDIDTLIPAIGQIPDLTALIGEKRINISEWGTINICPESTATSVEGIFAGGDAVSGPATVTEAMAHGKTAAESVHRYLRGESIERKYEVTKPSRVVPKLELTDKELEKVLESKRSEPQCIPIKERINTFKEVELPLSKEKSVQEAKRCLRCDLEEERR